MGNLQSTILGIILTIPAVMIAFVAQGYSKALVADKLGDRTPRFNGRLTMNPAAHLDPIGFVMILIIGFGWTKPLETNPRAFKRGYKDSIKVSIAAPIANLLVGFITLFLYTLIGKTLTMLPGTLYFILISVIANTATINIGLGIFTLLPLPGLAGFDIFRDLAPKKFYEVADKIYQYQMIILLGVIFFGQGILGMLRGLIINFYQIIINALLFFL